MLTAFDFTFDGTIIITIGFWRFAKMLCCKGQLNGVPILTPVSGGNIAIQRVNATDRALIAVNHHRHVVALHHFKKRTTLPFAVSFPLRSDNRHQAHRQWLVLAVVWTPLIHQPLLARVWTTQTSSTG